MLASAVIAGLPTAALAAENGSVTRVQLAFDGQCTAASPTTFGTTVTYTGATVDANGEDYVQIYHLDGNNTVVTRHTGSGTTHGAAVGVTNTANAFTRIVATPATAPYTAVLWDATDDTFDFEGGDTMDLSSPQVMATLDFDMNALDPDCPGVADTTPPTVSSVARQSPSTETTDADALTWRVSFDEEVQNVDASDFTVSGTTGLVSGVSAVTTSAYDVTVSGGDLADLISTVVGLGFAGGQDIQDAAGNALTNTTPGVNQTYTVDNTPDTTSPTVALTTDAGSPTNSAFMVTATFSEDVTGFSVGGFTVGNGAASNFSAASASVYTATITPAGDGPVTVDVASGAAQDGASNGNTAATQLTVDYDATAPGVAISSGASGTVGGPFSVTITFTEDVTGFTAGDIAVGNGAASDFSAASASVYTATITPAADGPVTVDVASGAAQDAAGNDSTAAAQFTVTKASDTTPPTVALTTDADSPIDGAFVLTATFSEAVTGFEVGDFTVGNGAASDFNAVSPRVYTAVITPASDGNVTVDVASGAAQDAAGNDSTAADQFSIGFDGTPPGLTISLPGSTAEGPFTATFTFSEAVSGFGLDDIATTNAAVSGLSEAGEGEYTATFTPETVGEVAIAVAAGAATDSAGNESEPGSASIEIVIPEVEVDLDLNAAVLDATTVSQTATLANPGSQSLAFVANADVDWVTVTPSSGTIPASGSIGITVTLNERAEQLEPGEYTGTVTVSTVVAAGQASTGRSEKGSTVVATIPITASVAERYGTLQIIATTPGGQQGDETFTYVSSDEDLNGLSLTTSGGLVASQAFRKVFGAYDLTQNLPQGWVLDSLNCSGDADGGSIIDVEAGTVEIDLDAAETIVCTFANTRDEDAIRLATMRAINNFMVRRADRIMTGAPDLSSRLRDRQSATPGRFSADVEGGNVMMNFAGSLSGLRNHAKANERQLPGSRQTAEPDEIRFDVWFAASYSALEDDRAGDRAESSFGLVQLGADWLVSENALVGVMVQMDEMSETAEDPVEAAGAVRGAELDGTGWMAGPYAVWEFADSATLDVSALWGQSDNTINPLGFYEDEFETTRYMVRANVTGEWKRDRTDAGQLVLRPGLSWTHFEETQDAYTDSLNIAIPEQTISIGRIEAGPEVAYRMDSPTGQGWWEPRAALRAVWDYDGADLMDESGRRVDDGQLRADLSIGLHGRSANGAVVSAEARISGLGDGDFSANTARIELRLPF